MMATTSDDGDSWHPYYPTGPVELLPRFGELHDEDHRLIDERLLIPDEPIDFHKNICKFRMTGISRGRSYWCASEDGDQWTGPYRLPLFGRQGLSARTCYLSDEANRYHCLAFFTAAKEADGREGQPLVAETVDGGQSWDLVSWIDHPPHLGFGIMPSAVRLADGKIICCVRWRERMSVPMYGTTAKPFGSGIICYESSDEGRTWDLISVPIQGLPKAGNPPDLVQLQDDRLALVYGWRREPYAIAVQISQDNGKSWSYPLCIRQDGGCHDLGYSRSFVREDGKVCSVYYWNDAPNTERYIAATIWELR
jgi:hypothetical protein